MSFSEEELYPGDATTLKVRADAGSLCSVAVVDKSVDVLTDTDNIDASKVKKIVSQLLNSSTNFV